VKEALGSVKSARGLGKPWDTDPYYNHRRSRISMLETQSQMPTNDAVLQARFAGCGRTAAGPQITDLFGLLDG
jgi:hypothetical protein